ncbi:unnamed protein product [Owenia fusiformis]|uniref:FAD-dependent oxidoreductase domain-containing protein 1 n=1 Tax=Owenia fusiformis TaxID=6347 RepID=A0A8S4P336_OWEFU|nr:unnamed protein product [Owenia fusiformis]
MSGSKILQRLVTPIVKQSQCGYHLSRIMWEKSSNNDNGAPSSGSSTNLPSGPLTKPEVPAKITERLPAGGEYRNPLPVLTGDYNTHLIPNQSDFLIIGGGIMGSSIAYWLKQRFPKGLSVTVIERDPTYSRASTGLSVGGIRQQFSVKENIQLSMYSAEFLRNIKEHLSVLDMDPPDVQFSPQGYLFLATADGAQQLHENHELQKSLGAKVELLSNEMLKKKFPWINTDGIELANYGYENEGWFDPWSLLEAFKRKAMSLGVEYKKGEVVGFEMKNMRGRNRVTNTIIQDDYMDYVLVRGEDKEVYPVKTPCCVVAAGAWSAEIARMANIGVDEDHPYLHVPLPVEPRKRYVYVVNCPNGPGLEAPFTIDPQGVYFRREGLGGNYVCGTGPTAAEEPSIENLDVDYNFFDEKVWPSLAHRIPAFESLKVKNAWAGYYDYNYTDQNLIIGNHPHHRNIVFVTGCSGHGIQHGPAIGRAVMEYLLDGDFKTIDLSRFSFDRFFAEDELIFEKNVV